MIANDGGTTARTVEFRTNVSQGAPVEGGMGGIYGEAHMRRLLFSNNIPLGLGILAGVIVSFGLLAMLMGMGFEWVHSIWVILLWSAVNLAATILGVIIASVEPRI